MKSRFKVIDSLINIIEDNHFESIIKYNNIRWKVIINNDEKQNITKFELQEVNSYFIFEEIIKFKDKESFNYFKELLIESIINKNYNININNNQIEFNFGEQTHILLKQNYYIDNQTLLDELLIIKKEQNSSLDTINKIMEENRNLKLDIVSLNENMENEINKLKNEQKLILDTIKNIFEENKNLKKQIEKIENETNELKNEIRKGNLNIITKTNTIKATYFIEKEDLNKEIKFIGLNLNPQKEDIKNNCKIYLNNQQINSPYKFEKEGEYNITLNFKKELEDISYLFYNCQQLKEIDLSNFKTQNAKNMKCMFSGCSKLIKVNLKNVNSNEVTDMKDMFSNCNSLIELDLSSFKTKKVKSMENMFSNCKSLEKINVSSFDVSHVTTMKCMFFNCEKLTQLDLSNFKNEDVKNISFMFTGCENLAKLDFSNFEKNTNTNITSIFLRINKNVNANIKEFLKNELINEINQIK